MSTFHCVGCKAPVLPDEQVIVFGTMTGRETEPPRDPLKGWFGYVCHKRGTCFLAMFKYFCQFQMQLDPLVIYATLGGLVEETR